MPAGGLRRLARAVGGRLCGEDGATVVFALVGFTIAAVAAMVVVSAAASNANRVKNERDKEQAYLYVSSAARLVTDAMKDYEFDYVGEPESYQARKAVTPATAQQVVQEAVGTMALAVANGGTADAPSPLTVSVGSDANTEIRLTMGGASDKPYNVTAEIAWENDSITYSAAIEFGATEHTAGTLHTVKWPGSQVRATKEPLSAAAGGDG